MIVTKLEVTIPAEKFAYWLMTLCDLPKEFFYCTIKENFKLELEVESENDRLYFKAKLQESLRKRFSVPKRMESNKNVIEFYEKKGSSNDSNDNNTPRQ